MHSPATLGGLRPLLVTSFVLLGIYVASAAETCMRKISDKREACHECVITHVTQTVVFVLEF